DVGASGGYGSHPRRRSKGVNLSRPGRGLDGGARPSSASDAAILQPSDVHTGVELVFRLRADNLRGRPRGEGHGVVNGSLPRLAVRNVPGLGVGFDEKRLKKSPGRALRTLGAGCPVFSGLSGVALEATQIHFRAVVLQEDNIV